jgi:3'5'-cyclic nucleotide phosphodiesterase
MQLDMLEPARNSDVYKHVWAMLSVSQVVDNYQIKPLQFINFIKETDNYYSKHDNPFHNFRHGATVMNAAYSMLRTTNLPKYFGKTGTSAFLFAALMHDVEHTGRNNMFEMNSSSKLAVRYNDNSVLENHHSARAFYILSKAEFNIFNKMHADEFPIFRKFVI